MLKHSIPTMLTMKAPTGHMIAKSCAFLAWVLYCVLAYESSLPQFFVGPLWLIGRGWTPTLLGWFTTVGFALLASGLVFHKSRISFVLTMLLIPAWLIVGVLVVNLADW
ncbi:MAG: hypothetical protein C0478_14115 [Planctomyces sp.]|nr:hypothetical protein [Planctomyces sp.]